MNTSRNTLMPIMERYLYASGTQPQLDSDGLLSISSYSLWSDFSPISLAEASNIPRGILVAEGGMGKTVFMEQLAKAFPEQTILLKVEEYRGDLPTFTSQLNVADKTILIDGLDENPDAAGSISRFLRQSPDAKLWISSRDVAAIHKLQKEFSIPTYHLAPLSRDNLCKHGGQSFLDAITQQGILSLCATPLVCNLALGLFYSRQLAGVTRQQLWDKGLKELCKQSQKQSSDPFLVAQIFQCAAWIALCSTLTDKLFMRDETTGPLPDNCLSCEEVYNNGNFSLDLIRTTLKRGVFRPLGDGRTAFAHSAYRDYLAAYAFNEKISPKSWDAVFFNEQRNAVWPSLAGFATWLATFNTEFRNSLLTVQPEMLIASNESIQSLGADVLCSELLRRADCLSYKQRNREDIALNLFRLKGQATPPVLKQYLLDTASTSNSIEMAISIIMACHYTELASLVADRAIDTTVNHAVRVLAAYAVSELHDIAAKELLKALLPIAPKDDPDDELLGSVLLACWPSHITAEELVTYLIQPQNKNLFGMYSHFIRELENTLETAINLDSAPVFLQWAVEHVASSDVDKLAPLARSIYTVCWKWAQYQEITPLLGMGYSKAMSAYRSPFQHDDTRGYGKKPYISKQAIRDNAADRLAVLEWILLCDSEKSEDITDFTWDDEALYYSTDLPHLFEKVLQGLEQGLATEPWIRCINSVLPEDISPYIEQIDKLHVQCPRLMQSATQIAKSRAQANEKHQQRQLERKQRQDANTLENLNNQLEIDAGVSAELDNATSLPAERFSTLCNYLRFEGGREQDGHLDIQQLASWAKLNDVRRNAFITLAGRYLKETKIVATNAGEVNFAIAKALTILRLLRPTIYDSLPKEVWARCGVELLKSAFSDNMKLLDPLFDTLEARAPDAAEQALLKVISQEIEHGSVFVLHHWGTRLTSSQAIAILDFARQQDNQHKIFRIINALALQGYEDLVRAYLREIFKHGWGESVEPEYHKLRTLAFVLSPAEYTHQVVAMLKSNPELSKGWLEYSINSRDNILTALTQSEIADITAMYIWLHEQYPPTTKPFHEGAYSPAALDNIHRLQDKIINFLTQCGKHGTAAALQLIAEKFPAETWMTNCVADARTAELSQNVPRLSVAEIIALCDSNHRLVNSTQDLLDVLVEQLSLYEKYLQDGTRAVNDLWNSRGNYISPQPKEEEALSDHIKRYLDLTMQNNIIINREVQINRKLYNDDESGSRTDLWVQATTPTNDNTLTVCIEVKCNWNPTAKSALQNQLISKYIAGGVAQGGILLLGWFACQNRDTEDHRKTKSTNTWSTLLDARADLVSQATNERESAWGKRVHAVVVDCSL